MSYPFYPHGLQIPQNLFDYTNLMRDMARLLTGGIGTVGGGIRIITDPFLPTQRHEQFRFPRSKKVRIRKKWRKNQRNWRTVDARGDIYFIGPRKSTALMHPDGFKALEKTIGVIKNCEVK